ncbi:MAG: HNH endonuclease [Actinobacteria bacterium]|nr:HNH endonuclease [Actinomycetota bacterium]
MDLFDQIDRDVLDATVEIHTHLNRLQAQQSRLLDRSQRAGAYRADGAVTLASWYAARTGMDGAAASRLTRRATRLRHYDQLRDAYQAGQVSSEHVDVIVRATTTRRYPALHEAEPALVTLARHGTPTDVRRAVKLIRDHTDPDGTDAEPMGPGPDERREVTVHPGIDGLGDLHGTLVPEVHELLAQLIETLATPDGKDVPKEQRRTAAQIRHDAFAEILRRAAAATLETKNGARPHVNLMIDLWTLLGREAAATFESRLRRTGTIDDQLARDLLAQWGLHDEGFLTNVILTAGPYRPVAFGRSLRTIPDWLRPLLEHIHTHCRYPFCDRPVAWTEADHVIPWADHGETEWDSTLPACKGHDSHHAMHTTGGWSATYDPHSGIATFTSPTGHQIRTHPPPRRC